MCLENEHLAGLVQKRPRKILVGPLQVSMYIHLLSAPRNSAQHLPTLMYFFQSNELKLIFYFIHVPTSNTCINMYVYLTYITTNPIARVHSLKNLS